MAFWRAPEPLVLASQSKVRRDLLCAAGLPVDIHPAAIDERRVEQSASGASAAEVARLLAAAKAAAVAQEFPAHVVLAADQTLSCGGRIYHKSKNRNSALEQLMSLRGRTHELHAAASVWVAGRAAFSHVETAQLTMRAFSPEFAEDYIDAAGLAAHSSVGGYQLEGIGIHLFEKIEGDYFTILGLPLLAVLKFLRSSGYLVD